jgi:predicted dehydrogenase
MEQTSLIKFAVIGMGLIGPRHAAAIKQDTRAVLACIVDPSPHAKAVAKDLNTTIYTSIQDMLQAQKPDAAIVCTPNHTHVAVSEELLNARIHVLVEKPISTDVPSAKRLVGVSSSPFSANSYTKIALAKARNLLLLVGHHRRFNRYVVTAKSILSSTALGKPLALNGLWTLYKPLEYFQPPTDWRRKSKSGGPVFINLIHEIDIMHHLLGPITRVLAERGVDSSRGPEHAVESTTAIILRFANEAIGTFLLADNTPSPFNFEAGTGENPTIPRVGMDFYRIFCSEAVLSIPDMGIWSYQAEGKNKSWSEELVKRQIDVPEMKQPFELQIRHFVNVILGQEKPSCSGEDGLRALVVCEAIRTACESGTAVNVGM